MDKKISWLYNIYKKKNIIVVNLRSTFSHVIKGLYFCHNFFKLNRPLLWQVVVKG